MAGPEQARILTEFEDLSINPTIFSYGIIAIASSLPSGCNKLEENLPTTGASLDNHYFKITELC